MFLDTVRQAFKPQRLVASLGLVKHTRLALIPRSVQSITARSISYLSTNAQPSATTIAPRLSLPRHHALTFDADVRAIHTQPQHAVDTATLTREAPELTGKTAIVTGGSRGIGLSVAKELLTGGASVVLMARQKTSLEHACRSLASTTRSHVHNFGLLTEPLSLTSSSSPPARQFLCAVQCNVGDTDSVQSAFKTLADSALVPSILVCAAGICHEALLLRATPERMREMLEVNVLGSLTTSKQFLRQHLSSTSTASSSSTSPAAAAAAAAAASSASSTSNAKCSKEGNPYGRIVFIGSVVGTEGASGLAAYSASKAALSGAARSLAKEYAGRNVTVNVVAPGFIDTDMTKNLSPARREAILAQVPVGRMGASDDVAAAVRFVCGPRAAYITGQTIAVDGGMS